jgi:ADP-heptose:LPS heptosyltransferase
VEHQENILFIRLRLLGDIIFTIPALNIYHQYYPDTRIYYVVEEKFQEIAKLIPNIHKVIVIPRKMTIKEMWVFRQEMKKIGFHTVVDFHSGPKSAQLSFLSGAKNRIGYRTPNRNWAYNRLTNRNTGDSPTHSTYNQAKLLEHFGIQINKDDIPQYPPFSIPEHLISQALIEMIVKNQKKSTVVIHVGAGNDFRDWGIDKFSGLIEKLLLTGVDVYLVGSGEAEKKKGVYFAERFPIHDLTNQLTIPELLVLISRSSVYLGADSGPLHLASLTPTPLVALYGPNLPEISGPWRSHDITIIQKHMECRPCAQRKCIYDIIPCMKTITTDEVYEAIIRYIQ